MDYSIQTGCWASVIAVPSIIVDKYLKLASGTALKVLLYSLRASSLCSSFSDKDIAVAIGASEEDIRDAFCFWEQLGLLAISHGEPPQTPAVVTQSPPVHHEAPQPASEAPLKREPKRYPPSELAKLVEENPELRFLFSGLENELSRLPNDTERNLALYLYTELGFPCEVILTLVTYCMSLGKCNPRYVEVVANSWYDKGITTLELANAEIIRLNERTQYSSMVLGVMGVTNKPSTKQKEFLEEWCRLGISRELIQLAYDRMIDTIGKVQFKYMNAILLDWTSKKITSPADLTKLPQNAKSEEHSYDLSTLEGLAVGATRRSKPE